MVGVSPRGAVPLRCNASGGRRSTGRGWLEVTHRWEANHTSMDDDAERIALCSEVVDRWIANGLGDVEAMLAIALITEPGARSFNEVAKAIRSRLEAGSLH